MSATHQFPPLHLLPADDHEGQSSGQGQASHSPASRAVPSTSTQEKSNAVQPPSNGSDEDQAQPHQLFLPAPGDADERSGDPSTRRVDEASAPPNRTLDLSTGGRVALDELGPMVVNKNGTLSRIHNWASMTQLERDRTLRVLGARNQLRMADIRSGGGGQEGDGGS